jgi:hypothetical protein
MLWFWFTFIRAVYCKNNIVKRKIMIVSILIFFIIIFAYFLNKQGKIHTGYHRRSKSENAFFRWKAILGAEM